jgi:hypothetical protein
MVLIDELNTPKALDNIVKFYKKGYSPILVFTGEMRCGKTTKAYLIAHWLSWLIFNKPWDWRDSVITNIKQFVEMIDSSKEEIIFLDEVQGFLNAKEWYSPNNIVFNKILQSQAYKHMIFILVLPYALGMAKDHRRLIHMLFWVKNRRNVYPVLFRKKFWQLEDTPNTFFFYPIIPFDKERKLIQRCFADELKELKEFTTTIEDVVKKGIMNDMKIKVGIIDEKQKKVFATFTSDGSLKEQTL